MRLQEVDSLSGGLKMFPLAVFGGDEEPRREKERRLETLLLQATHDVAVAGSLFQNLRTVVLKDQDWFPFVGQGTSL